MILPIIDAVFEDDLDTRFMEKPMSIEPQRIVVTCLLCPEGQQATFTKDGRLLGDLLKLWIDHVAETHPADLSAASLFTFQLGRMVDGIGNSAQHERYLVHGERKLASEVWSSGVLAIDAPDDQLDWVRRYAPRDLKDFQERRRQHEERRQRIAAGLVHRYEVVFELRIDCEAAFHDLARSGYVRDYRPREHKLTVEDVPPTMIDEWRAIGATASEVPVDA